jgi:hypothetical protein
MSTFELENNDLVFSLNGRLKMILGENTDKEIKQRVEIRLKTFKTEWFLDIQHGVPYFFDILGTKNIDFNILESLLREQILSVNGIKTLIQSSIDYSQSERKLIYNFQATTINNTTINTEVII